MRVLLSTIGSRGDVQPLVALGLELKSLGVDVRLCVPPDFRKWIEGLGVEVTPIGPELRPTARAGAPRAPLPEEDRRRMIEGTLAAQFETVAAAARGADLIVGATALQVAAPSVAERMGIPYVFAAYCPAVLPSAHHAPPVLTSLGDTPASTRSHADLWAEDARRWNDLWGPALNAHKASLGLTQLEDVRRYVLTDRPWLAADPTLAPWPGADEPAPVRSGAWMLADERPLSEELEAFLDDGDPPVYFGFGSIRAPEGLGRAMIEAARAVGRRSILSRGWAGLEPLDHEPDCLAVGEANHRALFRRVAAVVHHGGAGTTTTAACAGAPQLVAPQHYDQHYWAGRVQDLAIGTAHPPGAPSARSLARALEGTLHPDVAVRARSLAPAIRADGASFAAERLVRIIDDKAI